MVLTVETPTPYSIIRSASRWPLIRITLCCTLLAYSTADLVEITRLDEDALVRMFADQSTHETLDLCPAYRGLPALRLHIDHIQPQPVLIDDVVNAFIPRYLRQQCRLSSGAVVTHGWEKIRNQIRCQAARNPATQIRQIESRLKGSISLGLIMECKIRKSSKFGVQIRREQIPLRNP